MQRHHFLHESEVTRVRQKYIMAESSSTASISSEFWHRNQVDVPSFTNAFIEKMASENLSVKVTLTRGYKFFHESYIHVVINYTAWYGWYTFLVGHPEMMVAFSDIGISSFKITLDNYWFLKSMFQNKRLTCSR